MFLNQNPDSNNYDSPPQTPINDNPMVHLNVHQFSLTWLF